MKIKFGNHMPKLFLFSPKIGGVKLKFNRSKINSQHEGVHRVKNKNQMWTK